MFNKKYKKRIEMLQIENARLRGVLIDISLMRNDRVKYAPHKANDELQDIMWWKFNSITRGKY